MPKTEEENYVTKMLLQKIKFSTSSVWNGLWIGLTDNEHEGTWNWNDGTKPDFLYWAPGEPNGYSGENCAIIDKSARKWHDVKCSISDLYSAVCQLKATEEMCSCRCDYKRKLEHWESKIPQHQTMEDLKRELEPVIRKIQNELKVNKTNLSSTIRKLTSAKDERKSSHAIGFFGALFISVIFGTVFFMDIVMLRQQIDNIRKICGNKEKNIRQNLSRKKEACHYHHYSKEENKNR
ncbi:unnamed protein product [Mytilus edulis]|uniref:C-type lectin domain-containing protein n=1 Tax=Mytilus edulis TaxID=6550 RepID=A0A8S3TQ66_MYTED|nr:unnamed protein product [Mytilus edulis]